MKIAVIRKAQSNFEKILGEYAQITQLDPDEKICLADFDACAIESGWTVGEILMGIGYGIAIGMDK